MRRISAVIVTLNEEDNIGNAIQSVKPWVDEVILVDMMSNDRTVEIARDLGAKVFEHARVGFVEPARATAVDYASGDWILVLDADEMVSHALSLELRRVAKVDTTDVCRLPRLNYILGKPMIHGAHAPDRDVQVRFFRKHSLKFSDRIHSFPEPIAGARVYTVQFAGSRAIHHFHAATAAQLIEKMNRYTTTDAEQVFQAHRPIAPWRLAVLAPLIFAHSYIYCQGCRDGWRGLFWACLVAFYRFARDAKHLQLEECGPLPKGQSPYAREAEEVLRQYSGGVNADSQSSEIAGAVS